MKANWHLDDVAVDESDPFDGEHDVQIEGERIDLTDPKFLSGRLVELLLREGELERAGVTCKLKSRPDACCSACPLRGTHTAHGRRELCKLGTEQERTAMSLAALYA